MTTTLKRALVWTFIVAGQVAGVLNGIAAALAARDGRWGSALLYLVVAITLMVVSALAWYSTSRQTPYRWREGGDGGEGGHRPQ